MLLKNIKYLRILLLSLFIILLLLWPGLNTNIDRVTIKTFNLLGANQQPDTNLILIHADREDIERLGPYPLKRSYYALMINKLTALGVKAIGIEVFFSEVFASQSIYNILLNNEIDRSGKVVLASVIEKYGERDAAILFSQPAQDNPGIKTGYLNYEENAGVDIPLTLTINGIKEKAFSLALLEKAGITSSLSHGSFKVNMGERWVQFRNYSFDEFFQLIDNADPVLNTFRGKIIIIGVSSPGIARAIQSPAEGVIPGIALHAFAADNLMNGSYIRTWFNLPSAILFILVLAGIVIIWNKRNILLIYLITFIVLYLLSYLLLNFFYIEAAWSYFIVPLLGLIIADLGVAFYERIREMKAAKSKAESLSVELKEKESRLQKLQHELGAADDDSALMDRITELKSEIESLKLRENDSIPAEVDVHDVVNFQGMVYKSRTMKRVVDLIQKVAPADAPVLIMGESGTGKELAAHALHQLNERSKFRFVAVNCAALSETLLESELFGHVKGSFTGAIADKAGRFEIADKGTIFLDEIGETTENFQAKLLRVLQTGEFEKVGSSKTLKSNVRVIAATNKDLEKLMRENKFREDLYYRLNVITVYLPPLRERKEDIEPLVEHFIKQEKEPVSISSSALQQLITYNWRGNVRELQSVVKRAAIFARSANRAIITIADLPQDIIDRDKFNVENQILDSLRQKEFSHSSIAETAKELGGLSRTIVSENFRGMAFRAYVENGYNLDKCLTVLLGDNNDIHVKEKLKRRISVFIDNITASVEELNGEEIDEVKAQLSSKYKNLPRRYHVYLDEIIRNLLNK